MPEAPFSRRQRIIEMRWSAPAFVIVLLLLLAYLAWPFLGLKRIADAIENRNAAEFTELLDLPELKRSLAGQLVRAHLKLTGKDRNLSPLALNLAIAAGVAVADSYVVEIVRAEALMDLLKQTRPETFSAPSASVNFWGFPNLRHAERVLATEYRGRNFYIRLPLSADLKDSYRLRLRLSDWKWKLAGIDLPEEVQRRLVREFQNRH
jgi:Protein of unknown function (DUF2939)